MNSRRSFSKGALKINSAVQLTQSHKCCMVKFQLRHYTAVQLVFDEHWAFLMDSKLHFRCCLRVQAPNYSVSHMYVTHLQLLAFSFKQRPCRIRKRSYKKKGSMNIMHQTTTTSKMESCASCSLLCALCPPNMFFPVNTSARLGGS